MAKSNSNVAMYLNFALLISLLLIINMAESRLFHYAHGKAKMLTPTCVSIYGQQEGDTCFTITQAFNLTFDFFLQINPNLNCDTIFVGQWLCVDGFLS
ncbi:hypothetical protein ERO13_A10G139000v2 [Gossypium hirsutum]|uniref:LysM domain-containing protein n=4 Tax=Gossypium TaxID=3633 RepID=A0A2P5YI78_GOSBA|nr:hypothetical protein ES319_A10G149600v1 [Gossypium barbadense]KAG4180015.1 hypothetical protein ERO13_A10G139000v2 [Gossypium hirsutum]KAK5793600.1 hypothetical protein PVK06_034752 [Gossypium arboreum]TYG99065.1 hypothetical protein ES288_A10G166700v1 [Gossypium darwinii]TYJ14993.1 hypothetical protein E1A91_A10G154600v1 [Gossypium mustelinum]